MDYVVYVNDYTDPAVECFPAFAAGVEALRHLHAQKGSSSLAQMYGDIGRGLRWVSTELRDIAHDIVPPERNKLILTSIPELTKFVKLPESVPVGLLGADCNCACTCCCDCSCGAGCGCAIGLCIPETICGCCVGWLRMLVLL